MIERPRMGLRTSWQQPKAGADRALALRTLSERIDKLKGRRSTLQERHDSLEKDVGLAKGRVAAKGAVEKFIQELQQEAYRKSTHSFETLLTAITNEVLPNAKPIALDLKTERGMPSLSISVVGKGDTREDIFEDQGGALANVIGMGLRLIAVVKSRGQRFLALDEPECWTAPERVPAFFAVLEDAARRLDVQCLTITHHKGSANFSADVRVSKLVGHPETGATIDCDAPPPAWSDDMPGFRYLRLKNFQAIADATIDLAPGINAITGDNNHGKSCFMRALRAVFYGDTSDTHIRHGSDSTSVEIGLAGGRYLKFTRVRKGSPKNVWSLHEANGAVVVENGELRQTGGNEPPAWVDQTYGIVRHDGHDIHISHQKYPVFLIDKPGSKRAAVLSFGQESGYTGDMLAIQKERVAKDNALIRDGEREIGDLRFQLARLQDLDALSASVEGLIELAGRIEIGEQRVVAMEAVSRRLSAAVAAQEKSAAISRTLQDLPDAAALRAIENQSSHLIAADRLRARMLQASSLAIRSRATLDALATLPAAIPVLKDTTQAEGVARRYSGALKTAEVSTRRLVALAELPSKAPEITAATATATRNRYALALQNSRKAGQAVSEADRKLAAIRAEIEAAINAHRGHCPTCGSTISTETIFHEHAA